MKNVLVIAVALLLGVLLTNLIATLLSPSAQSNVNTSAFQPGQDVSIALTGYLVDQHCQRGVRPQDPMKPEWCNHLRSVSVMNGALRIRTDVTAEADIEAMLEASAGFVRSSEGARFGLNAVTLYADDEWRILGSVDAR